MRTAIVHDYLSQRGGAERVVLALSRLFPDAPVYTSFYVPEMTYPEFERLDVRTSSLQGSVRPDRFRRAVLRFPAAFEGLDLSGFDQVVVSSSAFAHHVRHPRKLVYCYTPPRFLYDAAAYLGGPLRGAVARPLLAPLRRRDRRAAATAVRYAAISEQTARRVREVYGREAPVIYPPLWTAHLPAEPLPPPACPRALVIARLLPYKRVDVAVRACARAGIGLTVVGEGPEWARLAKLAGEGATFLGRVDDACMHELFASHSVVLAPGIEDFGYGPLEANFAGRPVVAVAAGGALETVQRGVNGELVEGWDVDRWAAAIREVLTRTWSPGALRRTTTRFQAEVFERQLLEWVAHAPAAGG
ncbi:MAG TPA: glycosyltransferase [Acidimicrobiales bacterium]|nr:glycosyltransferase [Acidimicrobiales bacterium]